ncbi:2-oxoglutarate dehydrogenase complex dihydrolipoyllysine-residue succinyltransferase [bacterium]|nr:2-oxoglutarate dehydrogenase complex dihydrolipoyllysine-residue succinyltransferase [bacterium]
MKIDVKVPSVGESIKEAMLVEWYKKSGDVVKKDEPLFLIETDKVTLEVTSEVDGVLKTIAGEGDTVLIGDVVGTIDADGTAAVKTSPKEQPPVSAEPVPAKPTPAVPAPAAAAQPLPPAPEKQVPAPPSGLELSPAVRRLVSEKKVDVSRVTGTGPSGRITKGDVLSFLEMQAAGIPIPSEQPLKTAEQEITPGKKSEQIEETVRKPMSPIRRKIAERLLSAKNNTAMLTTFNEIDMGRVMEIRSGYKEAFKERHQVNLGFMSFFVKACVQALTEFPAINAFIEGSEMLYHRYYHVGVAVGSPRGLVVPVIRFADQLGFAEIEQSIVDFVKKIKDNRLELSDMEGGTFTITNGGVFGSLLSTPILNTPQSAILGMHKIEKRPIVINDEIVIRPMMYVALSYDHRIVDGSDAVTFLKRIKECIENPERLLMEV